MKTPRFAFAGDRDIAVWALKFILQQNLSPELLLVSAVDKASHAAELVGLCPHLPANKILHGPEFRSPESISLLRKLDLDYVIGIHFPYLVSAEILSIPRIGVLNLHPAYLPYNRGWHTPSWAILEDTPIGATLHFMDEGIDTGDIVHQKKLAISPGDTANSLYKRLKLLELEVFQEAWPLLVSETFERKPQVSSGTLHKRRDLFSPQVQRIDLNKQVRAHDLLQQLRALTTNKADEAAFFEVDGVRYRVRVEIQEELLSRKSN